MKVCTDACLFGAWVAGKQVSTAARLLDIGTGTGLLSLMIAQKLPGQIDAIEIDADAANQAIENIQQSPWHNRISVSNVSLDEWKGTGYNLIFTNPPFYEQDLKSNNQKRNLALHDTGLTLAALWQSVSDNLVADGQFAVLLPFHRLDDCLQVAGLHGFHLREQVTVQQTEMHAPFRVMLLFKRENNVSVQKSILIKKEGAYSIEFIALLKDYYLHL